ncbi:MAG: alpha/beta hydrolase [Fimbriimonadales bacterium]
MRVLVDQVAIDRPGVDLLYDVIMPSTTVAVPSVICIHGGGWISGDRTEMHPVASKFAENGFAAFCVGYRLAPLHPYPAAIEDCQFLVKHLRENAHSIGIKSDCIAAFGNSAGGHLAASLAVRDIPGDISCRVDAAIDVCGLTDLTNPQQNHPMISWDFINQFLGRKYEEDTSKWIDASPLFHVTEQSAPTLIFHGDEDDIVWIEQSKRLFEAMQEKGVPSRFEVLSGEGHSFTLGAFDRILNESIEFLSEQFSK